MERYVSLLYKNGEHQGFRSRICNGSYVLKRGKKISSHHPPSELLFHIYRRSTTTWPWSGSCLKNLFLHSPTLTPSNKLTVESGWRSANPMSVTSAITRSSRIQPPSCLCQTETENSHSSLKIMAWKIRFIENDREGSKLWKLVKSLHGDPNQAAPRVLEIEGGGGACIRQESSWSLYSTVPASQWYCHWPRTGESCPWKNKVSKRKTILSRWCLSGDVWEIYDGRTPVLNWCNKNKARPWTRQHEWDAPLPW